MMYKTTIVYCFEFQSRMASNLIYACSSLISPMLPVDPLYWGASPSPCWYLPDQSFSKPFYRKLAFARMIVVPCKTAVHTKRVQSLTGNAAPFSPKTIRIALWRTLPKLFCLFLHFFSLLFGGIGPEFVVHPS